MARDNSSYRAARRNWLLKTRPRSTWVNSLPATGQAIYRRALPGIELRDKYFRRDRNLGFKTGKAKR